MKSIFGATSALAGVLASWAAPAIAQEQCEQALSQVSAFSEVLRSDLPELMRLDYEIAQKERQWNSDRDIFVAGSSRDHQLGQQLHRDWLALRSLTAQAAAAMRPYSTNVSRQCQVIQSNTQCFEPGSGAKCAAMAAEGPGEVQRFEAKRDRFRADWRAQTPVSYVVSASGRAFVIRGVRTVPVVADQILAPGDVVSVEEGSAVSIRHRGSQINIPEKTKVEVQESGVGRAPSETESLVKGIEEQFDPRRIEPAAPTGVAGPGVRG